MTDKTTIEFALDRDDAIRLVDAVEAWQENVFDSIKMGVVDDPNEIDLYWRMVRTVGLLRQAID